MIIKINENFHLYLPRIKQTIEFKKKKLLFTIVLNFVNCEIIIFHCWYFFLAPIVQPEI